VNAQPAGVNLPSQQLISAHHVLSKVSIADVCIGVTIKRFGIAQDVHDDHEHVTQYGADLKNARIADHFVFSLDRDSWAPILGVTIA
jgi:hypothetical protein